MMSTQKLVHSIALEFGCFQGWLDHRNHNIVGGGVKSSRFVFTVE